MDEPIAFRRSHCEPINYAQRASRYAPVSNNRPKNFTTSPSQQMHWLKLRVSICTFMRRFGEAKIPIDREASAVSFQRPTSRSRQMLLLGTSCSGHNVSSLPEYQALLDDSRLDYCWLTLGRRIKTFQSRIMHPHPTRTENLPSNSLASVVHAVSPSFPILIDLSHSFSLRNFESLVLSKILRTTSLSFNCSTDFSTF